MKTATIILNRNLPDVTDRLVNHLSKDRTDVFVVESGSDHNKLSSSCTWHANWPEAMSEGLRAARGFNYGLLKLYEEGKFGSYDVFFLVTNDTEFTIQDPVTKLTSVLEKHPRVGILSPCSQRWGEKLLLQKEKTRYFWYILNTSLLIRREMMLNIMPKNNITFMNFLFDGANFRGYGLESELIAKGYANDWASAITTEVWAEENEKWLLTKADLIKTESFENNLELYLNEGLEWMHSKYGFNSRWHMQMYTKFWYDQFFNFHPEFEQYKI